MARKLDSITEALDEVSWFWMEDTHPQLAAAIEQEGCKGAGAAEIRRHVMQQTYRVELALRCEQAARFLARVLE